MSWLPPGPIDLPAASGYGYRLSGTVRPSGAGLAVRVRVEGIGQPSRQVSALSATLVEVRFGGGGRPWWRLFLPLPLPPTGGGREGDLQRARLEFGSGEPVGEYTLELPAPPAPPASFPGGWVNYAVRVALDVRKGPDLGTVAFLSGEAEP